MAKNTNLKGFTSTLRNIIDKNLNIVQKDYQNLIKKYELSPEDIDKVEALSSKYLTEAKEKLDYGSWREAEDLVIEALITSPFNKEALEFYLNTAITKEKELGAKRGEEYSIYLNRLGKVDKLLYRKFTNLDKERIKVSPLWLLSLLLIPMVVVAIKLEPKAEKPFTVKKQMNINPIGTREIEAEYIKLPNSKIDFNLVNATLNGFKDRYNFELKGNFISNENNISYIKGRIIWIDNYNQVIFKESFETTKGATYYPKEDIPLFYTKSSKRTAPPLVKVLLEIDEVLSSKGQERGDEIKLPVTYGGRNYKNIGIYQVESSTTEGVTANYLSTTLRVENQGDKPLEFLKADLVWYDFYKVEKFRITRILLDYKDSKIGPGESKIIPLVLEIKDYYNDLEIELVGINERER